MNAAELPAVLHTWRYEGLDLLSTAVMLVDGHGRIAHVNQAAELLFDTSRKTLVGNWRAAVLGTMPEMRQWSPRASQRVRPAQQSHGAAAHWARSAACARGRDGAVRRSDPAGAGGHGNRAAAEGRPRRRRQIG